METYFLVWDREFGKGTGVISNARRAQRTIDGFPPGSYVLPKSAASTVAALVADLKANPTAGARVESYANEPGKSADQNEMLAYDRARAVQDRIIADTNNSILTNEYRFDLQDIVGTGPHAIVVTVDRPGP